MSYLNVDADGGHLLVAPGVGLLISPDISITLPGIGPSQVGTVSAVQGKEIEIVGGPGRAVVGRLRVSTGVPHRADVVILLGREEIGKARLGRPYY